MTRMSKIAKAGILSAVVIVAGAVFAQDSLPINVYPCPKADVAPVLDGRLDDAVWQNAPVVSAFFMIAGTDKPAKVQTSFRVLWDDQNLYFGIRCDEPLMARLSPLVFSRDVNAIFGNEAIELFVDPNHSHDLYYQLAMDAAGSLYDACRTNTSWESDTVVKAFRTGDFWSLEIAIPFKSLNTAPKAGKVIGFNVCRDRSIGGENKGTINEGTIEWTSWSRTTDFHAPAYFAYLVLSGTPDQIVKLADELRKGHTGPIVVYGAENFSQKTYSQLAAVDLANLDKLLADAEAERGREPNQSAAAELGLRLATYRQQAAAMRVKSQGILDAATWVRMDIEMQQTIGVLQKVIGEVRLNALLNTL